jgi:hypothetical protein
MFTAYSHPKFLLPASGLRLETVPKSDKKKSELYFSSLVKKILTEKSKSTVAQTPFNDATRMRLTDPARTGNFVRFRCP